MNGRKEGKKEKSIEITKKLLEMGISVEKIISHTILKIVWLIIVILKKK